MYHPISSKMENYSAPTGRLWFMYSNLELFRVQKACLYTAAEGQIANRTGTFTLALLGSKLTSLWAAGANSPQSLLKQRDRNSGETEKKTLKNSLTPDFSLACEACDNKPQWKRCAACCKWVCGWAHVQPDTGLMVHTSLTAIPPEHRRQ